MDDAHIRVQRRHAWTDRARAYEVAVDGEVVGSLRDDQEEVFDVPPGRHEVELRLNWTRSRPVEVDLRPGEQARLSGGPRKPPLSLFTLAVGRNRYLALEDADQSR